MILAFKLNIYKIHCIKYTQHFTFFWLLNLVKMHLLHQQLAGQPVTKLKVTHANVSYCTHIPIQNPLLYQPITLFSIHQEYVLLFNLKPKVHTTQAF